jgi:ADP-ribose pyrophosphatase YjhB (NUDIX family)
MRMCLSFEDAAKRELKEEVGLDAVSLELIYEGRHENPCRREDGTWHYWKLYRAEVTGEVERSEEETKQAGWYTKEEVEKLDLEPIMRDLFAAIKIL